MGKTLRKGRVSFILAVLFVTLQIYCLKSFPQYLSQMGFALAEHTLRGIFPATMFFLPAIAAIVLFASGIKSYFSPHPIIKERYGDAINYKTSTLVCNNLRSPAMAAMCLLCVLAVLLLPHELMPKLTIIVSATEPDAEFYRSLWEIIFTLLCHIFLIYSTLVCDVENPSESYSQALTMYAGIFVVHFTRPESATYVFRDTTSPIRPTQFFSVVVAIIFILLRIFLKKRGTRMYKRFSFSFFHKAGAALALLLVLAPVIPNFDILFLSQIASETSFDLVAPLMILVYPYAILPSLSVHTQKYKKYLIDEHGIDLDKSILDSRIDYYDFSGTQKTDHSVK